MDYVIVMPAYNEARHIGITLASIDRQLLLPVQLVVVNDGSTDRTAEIAAAFARTRPWVTLVNNEGKPGHAPGGKVVRAFYSGFDKITAGWDFIVKLDADLELPENYFSRIAEMFRERPQLGIAGGIAVVMHKGRWVYEGFADRDHVRGPFKSYRRACFEAIGGLRESVGWDSVDEMLAIYHGWECDTDPGLQVRHFRETGAETGAIRVKKMMGWAMYRMRYGPFITLVSAVKAGLLNKPYLLTGLACIQGWLEALLRGDDFIVSKEEGQFIRRYRRKRMLEKLGLHACF